jgi:hypothetical protein
MTNVTINVNNDWDTTNVTEAAVVELKCFCVPNQASYWKDLPEYAQRWFKSRLELLGIPVLDGEDDNPALIQVWVHTDVYDNLTDHGIPDAMCKILGAIPKELEGFEYYKEYAPGYIPLWVLKGIHEGDTREFTAPSGAKVRITFSQEGKRYSQYGDFQDCVLKALSY